MNRFRLAITICALAIFSTAGPSFATDLNDIQSWYADSRDCSIFSFEVMTDERDSSDRVALVSFSGTGVSSSYATWTRSSDQLTLTDFKGRPSDTFSGTIVGSRLTATHTWRVKHRKALRSETCTFVLG
jgi:hypothetical protein